MKLINKLNSLSKNKMVLYVLYFITVLNVFGYLSMNNFKSFALFTLILYLTTFFSKNTAMILIIPLLITNLFGDNIQFVEGFKEGNRQHNHKIRGTSDPTLTHMHKDGDESHHSKAFKLTKKEKEGKRKGKREGKKGKKREGFDDGGGDDASAFIDNEAMSTRRKDRESMEKQYDMLSNMVGAEGIQKMTNDTKKLIDKQQTLNESMKAMGPLLDNAKGLLEGFNLEGLSGVQDAIKSLSKKK